MRILLASHRFPPRHRAGVEVYSDAVARGLRRAGEDVAVVTTDDGPGRRGRIREGVADGLPVFTVVHPRAVREPEDTLGDPAGRAAFVAVLDRFRPDVVHFQHLMYLGIDLPAVARARGIPVVLTLHEYWLLCARGGQFLRADGVRCESAEPGTCARCLSSHRFGRTPWEARIGQAAARVRALTGYDLFARLKRMREGGGSASAADGSAMAPWPDAPDPRMLAFLDRRREAIASMIPAVDLFLAPSRFLMRKFIEAGWPAGRFRHWPNGIREVPRVHPDARVPGGGPLRVGYVGSIVPQKGLDVLLRAHARLDRGLATVRVHGSGADRPAYAARVRSLAVPGEVDFAGPFPEGAAGAAYGAMDVLVVPSTWYENAPLVIGEANAFGVPVVASRLGGMAEAVRDGVDGLLFEPGDDAGLARVLDRLARRPGDLAALRSGISPPRTLDDDVNGLRDLYRTLVGACR